MPTPIELALTSLLPTSSHLSSELIDLTTSLIAQSRLKAARLKPEEEIGRIYACCQIACQTLQNRLHLDLSKPTPPCPPRVYSKLLAFLQSVLSAAPATPKRARPTTPRTAERESGSITRAIVAAGEVTPTPKRTTSRSAGKVDSSPVKRELDVASDARPNEGHGEHVMPLIRRICTFLGEAKAAPHAYVGLDVLTGQDGSQVERETKKRGKTSKRQDVSARDKNSQVLAHVIVACGLAVSRMLDFQTRGRAETLCRRAVFFVADTTDALSLDGSTDETKERLLQTSLALLEEHGDEWREAEWYENIPIGTTLEDSKQSENDHGDDGPAESISRQLYKTPLRRREKHARRDQDGEERVGAAGLLPGLGTMFQPSLDWLSTERQTELTGWKRDVLGRIAIAEQSR